MAIPVISILSPSPHAEFSVGEPFVLEFALDAGPPAHVNLLVHDLYAAHQVKLSLTSFIVVGSYGRLLHAAAFKTGHTYAIALPGLPVVGFHDLWVRASDKLNPAHAVDRYIPLRIVYP